MIFFNFFLPDPELCCVPRMRALSLSESLYTPTWLNIMYMIEENNILSFQASILFNYDYEWIGHRPKIQSLKNIFILSHEWSLLKLNLLECLFSAVNFRIIEAFLLTPVWIYEKNGLIKNLWFWIVHFISISNRY